MAHFGDLIAGNIFSRKKVGLQLTGVKTEPHSVKSQPAVTSISSKHVSPLLLYRALSALQTCPVLIAAEC